MATKEDVLKELNWVTEKISSLVWTVNLSTLATTWSLLIGSASIPTQYRLQRASEQTRGRAAKCWLGRLIGSGDVVRHPSLKSDRDRSRSVPALQGKVAGADQMAHRAVTDPNREAPQPQAPPPAVCLRPALLNSGISYNRTHDGRRLRLPIRSSEKY